MAKSLGYFLSNKEVSQVGIFCGNRYEWVIVDFACALHGFI
jgi:long-subunit acyl-CoA synthetase (AMP-forming)